jgi:putative flippase GtrA
LQINYATIRQIVRYGVVGIMNNLLGYCIYLAVTFLGLDPKLTVTLLYPIGAIAGYFGHSKYSFAYKGKSLWAPVRYAVAHIASYGVNVLMLYFFWERLGYPHQLIQALSIFVCAGVLFVLFRYFVFPTSGKHVQET